MTEIEKQEEKEKVNNPCPVCGEELEIVSKCAVCHNCGFSLCSM